MPRPGSWSPKGDSTVKSNPESEVDLFVDELMEERNPRAIVLVAASKIDNILAEILGTYFLAKYSRPKDQDELLGIWSSSKVAGES